MKFVQAVKDNPIVSVLTGFILIMTTVTGTLTATGQLDALVVTEAELHDHAAEPHAAASEAIDELKNWNRCDRLERRLDALDDRLYRLTRDEADADVIRDVERDIEAAERQYDALGCAEVLAG